MWVFKEKVPQMAHICIKEVAPTLFKMMLKPDKINTVRHTVIYKKMPIEIESLW